MVAVFDTAFHQTMRKKPTSMACLTAIIPTTRFAATAFMVLPTVMFPAGPHRCLAFLMSR